MGLDNSIGIEYLYGSMRRCINSVDTPSNPSPPRNIFMFRSHTIYFSIGIILGLQIPFRFYVYRQNIPCRFCTDCTNTTQPSYNYGARFYPNYFINRTPNIEPDFDINYTDRRNNINESIREVQAYNSQIELRNINTIENQIFLDQLIAQRL